MSGEKDSIDWSELTQEEFEQAFPLPEFMPLAELGDLEIKLVDDDAGMTWAAIDSGSNWIFIKYCAVIAPKDNTLKIALRAHYSDQKPPALKEGDIPLVYRAEWIQSGRPHPFPEAGMHRSFCAIKLPFKPETIELVDHF